jgi:VWFA-related protein
MKKGAYLAGIAIAGLTAAAVSSTAGAQDPAPPALFGERVDVEVVNVDVVVTDRKGNRITDLRRDEFELRIDGETVPIEYFSAPALAATEAGETRELVSQPASPVEILPRSVDGMPQRLIVVFVDQSALGVNSSSRIVGEIAEFVLPKMDGTTSVLVATFVESLRVLAPMTTDWAVVAAALEELEALRGRGSILERERMSIEADIRSFMIGLPLGEEDDDIRRRSEFLQSQRSRIESEIRHFGERSLDRQLRSVRALRDWVNALAAIEGRKSLLFGSQGYTSDPVAYLQRQLDTALRTLQGSQQGFATIAGLQTAARELAEEFEATLGAAQNARVAVYTVSPRTPPAVLGNAESAGSITELLTAPLTDASLIDASSSLVRLGAATGGGSLYLDDGLSRNLERVIDDEAASYSLGFTTGSEAGTREHRISVVVSRPDLRVRTRDRFRRRTLPERAEQALSAATSLAAASNPLGVAIEFGEPEGGDEKSSIVPLLVRIPLNGLSFVPEGGRLLARLSAQVAILDARGVQRFGPVMPIAIDVAATDEARLATEAWAYRAPMRLAPGEQRVAVVITDEVGGVLSVAMASIDVTERGTPQ